MTINIVIKGKTDGRFKIHRSKEPGCRLVHSFSTYFFESYSKKGHCDVVKRLTRNVNIFATSIVFIPVNVDQEHWILVAIEMELYKIVYYDGKYNEPEAKMVW